MAFNFEIDLDKLYFEKQNKPVATEQKKEKVEEEKDANTTKSM